MKKLEKYESPCVEVIDVEVEKGFAVSGASTESMTETDGFW